MNNNKMIKKTKYFVKSKYKEDYLLMSLISGNIIALPKVEFRNILDYLENKNDTIDEKLFNILLDNEFIFDNSIDELQIVKLNYWNKIFSKDSLTLTLLPTLSCNCDCKYCYQKNIKYKDNKYSIEDENKMLSYINNLDDNIKNLSINWYGGEPLLNLNFIKRFSSKVIDICKNKNINLTQSLSSNLSLDIDNLLKSLEEIEINIINTTIAGSEKIHNYLRPLNNLEASFSKTINNIVKLSRSFKISISINVTKLNIYYLKEILDYFHHEHNCEKLYFSFSNVESYENNDCSSITVPEALYQNKIIKALNHGMDIGLNMCDMSCFENDGVFCSGYLNNSYMISPKGLLYKCTDKFIQELSIGELTDLGSIKNNKRNNNYIYDVFENDECLNCMILPYCKGGCIESRNRGKNPCPTEKDFLAEYLTLYYRRIMKINGGGEDDEENKSN